MIFKANDAGGKSKIARGLREAFHAPHDIWMVISVLFDKDLIALLAHRRQQHNDQNRHGSQ